MEEFLCLNLVSQPGENNSAFGRRLTEFWTKILRSNQSDFEKVFAESTEFERRENAWIRMYLIEPPVVGILTQELRKSEILFDPVDETETFSRYEAVPPEWMPIEH